MNVRLALIEALPRIIAESVKPMENIEGIKILHVDGLQRRRRLARTASANGYGGGGLADQAVDAALRYRSQAPLIDALMQELGLNGGSLDGLVSGATKPALASAAGPGRRRCKAAFARQARSTPAAK